MKGEVGYDNNHSNTCHIDRVTYGIYGNRPNLTNNPKCGIIKIKGEVGLIEEVRHPSRPRGIMSKS